MYLYEKHLARTIMPRGRILVKSSLWGTLGYKSDLFPMGVPSRRPRKRKTVPHCGVQGRKGLEARPIPAAMPRFDRRTHVALTGLPRRRATTRRCAQHGRFLFEHSAEHCDNRGALGARDATRDELQTRGVEAGRCGIRSALASSRTRCRGRGWRLGAGGGSSVTQCMLSH